MIKCVCFLGFTYENLPTASDHNNTIAEAMAFANRTVEDPVMYESASGHNNTVAEAITFENRTVEDPVMYESASGHNNTVAEAMAFANRTVEDPVMYENDTTSERSSVIGSNLERSPNSTVPDSENDNMMDPNSPTLSDTNSQNDNVEDFNEEESDFEEIVPEGFRPIEEESDIDSGTEYDMINTPEGIPQTPTNDTLEEVLEDFDYEMELFDWENFQEDLDSVEDIDFSRFLV